MSLMVRWEVTPIEYTNGILPKGVTQEEVSKGELLVDREDGTLFLKKNSGEIVSICDSKTREYIEGLYYSDKNANPELKGKITFEEIEDKVDFNNGITKALINFNGAIIRVVGFERYSDNYLQMDLCIYKSYDGENWYRIYNEIEVSVSLSDVKIQYSIANNLLAISIYKCGTFLIDSNFICKQITSTSYLKSNNQLFFDGNTLGTYAYTISSDSKLTVKFNIIFTTDESIKTKYNFTSSNNNFALGKVYIGTITKTINIVDYKIEFIEKIFGYDKLSNSFIISVSTTDENRINYGTYASNHYSNIENINLKNLLEYDLSTDSCILATIDAITDSNNPYIFNNNRLLIKTYSCLLNLDLTKGLENSYSEIYNFNTLIQNNVYKYNILDENHIYIKNDGNIIVYYINDKKYDSEGLKIESPRGCGSADDPENTGTCQICGTSIITAGTDEWEIYKLEKVFQSSSYDNVLFCDRKDFSLIVLNDSKKDKLFKTKVISTTNKKEDFTLVEDRDISFDNLYKRINFSNTYNGAEFEDGLLQIKKINNRLILIKCGSTGLYICWSDDNGKTWKNGSTFGESSAISGFTNSNLLASRSLSSFITNYNTPEVLNNISISYNEKYDIYCIFDGYNIAIINEKYFSSSSTESKKGILKYEFLEMFAGNVLSAFFSKDDKYYFIIKNGNNLYLFEPIKEMYTTYNSNTDFPSSGTLINSDTDTTKTKILGYDKKNDSIVYISYTLDKSIDSNYMYNYTIYQYSLNLYPKINILYSSPKTTAGVITAFNIYDDKYYFGATETNYTSDPSDENNTWYRNIIFSINAFNKRTATEIKKYDLDINQISLNKHHSVLGDHENILYIKEINAEAKESFSSNLSNLSTMPLFQILNNDLYSDSEPVFLIYNQALNNGYEIFTLNKNFIYNSNIEISQKSQILSYDGKVYLFNYEKPGLRSFVSQSISSSNLNENNITDNIISDFKDTDDLKFLRFGHMINNPIKFNNYIILNPNNADGLNEGSTSEHANYIALDFRIKYINKDIVPYTIQSKDLVNQEKSYKFNYNFVFSVDNDYLFAVIINFIENSDIGFSNTSNHLAIDIYDTDFKVVRSHTKSSFDLTITKNNLGGYLSNYDSNYYLYDKQTNDIYIFLNVKDTTIKSICCIKFNKDDLISNGSSAISCYTITLIDRQCDTTTIKAADRMSIIGTNKDHTILYLSDGYINLNESSFDITVEETTDKPGVISDNCVNIYPGTKISDSSILQNYYYSEEKDLILNSNSKLYFNNSFDNYIKNTDSNELILYRKHSLVSYEYEEKINMNNIYTNLSNISGYSNLNTTLINVVPTYQLSDFFKYNPDENCLDFIRIDDTVFPNSKKFNVVYHNGIYFVCTDSDIYYSYDNNLKKWEKLDMLQFNPNFYKDNLGCYLYVVDELLVLYIFDTVDLNNLDKNTDIIIMNNPVNKMTLLKKDNEVKPEYKDSVIYNFDSKIVDDYFSLATTMNDYNINTGNFILFDNNTKLIYNYSDNYSYIWDTASSNTTGLNIKYLDLKTGEANTYTNPNIKMNPTAIFNIDDNFFLMISDVSSSKRVSFYLFDHNFNVLSAPSSSSYGTILLSTSNSYLSPNCYKVRNDGSREVEYLVDRKNMNKFIHIIFRTTENNNIYVITFSPGGNLQLYSTLAHIEVTTIENVDSTLTLLGTNDDHTRLFTNGGYIDINDITKIVGYYEDPGNPDMISEDIQFVCEDTSLRKFAVLDQVFTEDGVNYQAILRTDNVNNYYNNQQIVYKDNNYYRLFFDNGVYIVCLDKSIWYNKGNEWKEFDTSKFINKKYISNDKYKFRITKLNKNYFILFILDASDNELYASISCAFIFKNNFINEINLENNDVSKAVLLNTPNFPDLKVSYSEILSLYSSSDSEYFNNLSLKAIKDRLYLLGLNRCYTLNSFNVLSDKTKSSKQSVGTGLLYYEGKNSRLTRQTVSNNLLLKDIIYGDRYNLGIFYNTTDKRNYLYVMRNNTLDETQSFNYSQITCLSWAKIDDKFIQTTVNSYPIVKLLEDATYNSTTYKAGYYEIYCPELPSTATSTTYTSSYFKLLKLSDTFMFAYTDYLPELNIPDFVTNNRYYTFYTNNKIRRTYNQSTSDIDNKFFESKFKDVLPTNIKMDTININNQLNYVFYTNGYSNFIITHQLPFTSDVHSSTQDCNFYENFVVDDTHKVKFLFKNDKYFVLNNGNVSYSYDLKTWYPLPLSNYIVDDGQLESIYTEYSFKNLSVKVKDIELFNGDIMILISYKGRSMIQPSSSTLVDNYKLIRLSNSNFDITQERYSTYQRYNNTRNIDDLLYSYNNKPTIDIDLKNVTNKTIYNALNNLSILRCYFTTTSAECVYFFQGTNLYKTQDFKTCKLVYPFLYAAGGPSVQINNGLYKIVIGYQYNCLVFEKTGYFYMMKLSGSYSTEDKIIPITLGNTNNLTNTTFRNKRTLLYGNCSDANLIQLRFGIDGGNAVSDSNTGYVEVLEISTTTMANIFNSGSTSWTISSSTDLGTSGIYKQIKLTDISNLMTNITDATTTNMQFEFDSGTYSNIQLRYYTNTSNTKPSNVNYLKVAYSVKFIKDTTDTNKKTDVTLSCTSTTKMATNISYNCNYITTNGLSQYVFENGSSNVITDSSGTVVNWKYPGETIIGIDYSNSYHIYKFSNSYSNYVSGYRVYNSNSQIGYSYYNKDIFKLSGLVIRKDLPLFFKYGTRFIMYDHTNMYITDDDLTTNINNKTLFGYDEPTSSIGNNGDFYIKLDGESIDTSN